MNFTNIETCRNYIDYLSTELNKSINENINSNNIIKLKEYELNMTKNSIKEKKYLSAKNGAKLYKQK